MWNLLNNEVHAICDVTFNERAFFSGNIDDLRDDLLCISDERLQALLEAHRAPGNNSDTSIATQEEDEELSNLPRYRRIKAKMLRKYLVGKVLKARHRLEHELLAVEGLITLY